MSHPWMVSGGFHTCAQRLFHWPLCSQAREHGCFPSCRREDPVTSCLGHCRAGVEWTVAYYIFLMKVRNVVFLACPVLRP